MPVNGELRVVTPKPTSRNRPTSKNSASGLRGLIPAPTVSASGPISLPHLAGRSRSGAGPAERSPVGRRPAERLAADGSYGWFVTGPSQGLAQPVGAAPQGPSGGPAHGLVRPVEAERPAPLTRRQARALADAQAAAQAQTLAQVLAGPAHPGVVTEGAPVPLSRAQARALAHSRASQAVRSADPLRSAPPSSRAERRAAERLAARRGRAVGGSARGRRAALTVAVVGLGVALIHDGVPSAVAGGTSGSSTNTAALRLAAAAAGSTATTDQTQRDLLDTYAYHSTERRHRRRTPSASPAASTDTPSATASDTTTPSPALDPSPSVPGSLSASPSLARVIAAGVGSMGKQMYGTTRSGLPWFSGWWVGGNKTSDSMAKAEAWRGSQMDFATAYPEYSSWSAMSNSAWSISVWKGYGGRLAYGLPLLPQDRRGQWSDVTSGAHDDVFRTIAQQMVDNGFGDSAIRVGLEANGDWFPWGANASSASQYKEAFRHVVGVMRAVAPKLTFWFDTSASSNPLPGTSGRGATMLNTLYPGDDVVDGVSMDHYDFYSLVAHTDQQFKDAMSPPSGTGLQDAVDFARTHGKGFAVPEWGLHGVQGAGDNPFFMQKMFDFFMANKDVLVFENYFDEPDSYIANSLMSGQDPQSAAVYRKLWAGK